MIKRFPELLKKANQTLQNLKTLTASLMKTFGGDNRAIFSGLKKTYERLEENGPLQPEENAEVATTVKKELLWFKKAFCETVNLEVSRENNNAKAINPTTVVLGVELGSMSATSLLNLQDKLSRLESVVKNIPTRDDTYKWEIDDGQKGTFKRVDVPWTYRTEKEEYPMILAPETPKHAAKVEVRARIKQVGKWHTRMFSGAISVEQKSLLLEKIIKAIQDVTQAREEANNFEVSPLFDKTEDLYDTIFEGVI
jgi:hypothetical protein